MIAVFTLITLICFSFTLAADCDGEKTSCVECTSSTEGK